MPEETKGCGSEAVSREGEIVRLNKVIRALMDHAERSINGQSSDFGIFQTTIMLEEQVRRRTAELEAAKPEVILLGNSGAPRPFDQLLASEYRLTYMDNVNRLYVRKSINAPARP